MFIAKQKRCSEHLPCFPKFWDFAIYILVASISIASANTSSIMFFILHTPFLLFNYPCGEVVHEIHLQAHVITAFAGHA